jgi:hypothetical protein
MIHKLMIRSETIRAFRALDNRDLARAIGGDEAVAYESGKVNCPGPAVVVMTAANG